MNNEQKLEQNDHKENDFTQADVNKSKENDSNECDHLNYRFISRIRVHKNIEFGINQKKSILLICSDRIKVSSISNNFKLLQKMALPFQDQAIPITQVILMKHSNHFITPTYNYMLDSTVIYIWSQIVNYWSAQIFIVIDDAFCRKIILNENEDVLISMNTEEKIKFWSKALNWKCKQEITLSGEQLIDFNINPSQTRLIIESNMKLFIVELLTNDQWSIKQIMICSDFQIFSSQFIQDDIFICYTSNHKLLLFQYQSTVDEYQFLKYQECQLSLMIFFHLINQKLIILSQDGQIMNFLVLNTNLEIKLCQTVDFLSDPSKVVFSFDGEYLIIKTLNGFEIRKNCMIY